MKIKITVSSAFTPVAMVKKVKADIKAFTSVFTAEDLFRFAKEEYSGVMYGDVIMASGDAFPESIYDSDSTTTFHITIVVMNSHRFYKVRAYFNIDGEIDTKDGLFHVEEYTEV